MPLPRSDLDTGHRPTVDTHLARAPAQSDEQAEFTEAHLLRLCLDMQMHTLLLTLGAAAAGALRDPAEPRAFADSPPWRRWVSEDVDVAVALASDTLARGGTLPSTLGSDLHRSVPATTVDTLIALHESMTRQFTHLARTEPTSERRLAILEHCEKRGAELANYRLAATPPRGITLPQAEHHFLPGELLG